MGHHLTDAQGKLIEVCERMMALKPTPQIRFFWKKLRSVVLPKIPRKGRNQSAKEYALAQLRWQRLAALACESHVAAGSLLAQEIEMEVQLEEANAAKGQALTPEQAAAQLEELVLSATDRTQYRIFRRLLEAHPGWVEE